MAENSEDILADALGFLGEPVINDEFVQYGRLRLTVAPKEGKANTLLADHLFSPSILLAELVERGLLGTPGCSVVELGAGCALPSLLMATVTKPPSLVVVTDYPDDIILGNLQKNVKRNLEHYTDGCDVQCIGYEWGKDVGALLKSLPPMAADSAFVQPVGYDIVILSDLLHFSTSHDVLLLSLTSLLARNRTSRAYVAAGNYTPSSVCDNFLREGEKLGIVWQEGGDHENSTTTKDGWHGTLEVSGLDKEQLATRKNACRWWLGCWLISTDSEAGS